MFSRMLFVVLFSLMVFPVGTIKDGIVSLPTITNDYVLGIATVSFAFTCSFCGTLAFVGYQKLLDTPEERVAGGFYLNTMNMVGLFFGSIISIFLVGVVNK